MRRLLFGLLISLNSYAFHKDFALVNDRAPVEFKLLFESMKYTLKDMQDQTRRAVPAHQQRPRTSLERAEYVPVEE